MSGYLMRECLQGDTGSMERPMGSAVVASSSVQPAGHGRGARGAASSSGTQNHTYALVDRQNLEVSPDEVTGIISVFSHNVYALINLDPTLSYVSPLIAAKFERTPELLVIPFEVYAPVGEFIIVKKNRS